MSRIAVHSVSVIVLLGSIFDLIVLPPGRKTHSWGTAIMRERRDVRFTVRMSVSSIVKVRPGVSAGSSRRKRKSIREDFPLPDVSGKVLEGVEEMKDVEEIEVVQGVEICTFRCDRRRRSSHPRRW